MPHIFRANIKERAMNDTHAEQSITLFGAETLFAQLEALTEELPGVRLAEDIECVHHMRVASRRLRTRLTLFAPWLPAKKVDGWRKRIRRITTALGAARDTDVQLAFVQQFHDQLTDPRDKPGIARLLLRLHQRRQELQRKVLKALTELEDSHTLAAMSRTVRQLRAQSSLQHVDAHSPALFTLAAQAISTRLAELLSYEPYVHQPERIAELHAMRIATKHLRYVMEVFAPLYTDELKPYIRAARTLQEQLGELHDCDVWAQQLAGFLDDERRRALDYQGSTRGLSRLHAGIQALIDDRGAHRDESYQKFVATWEQLTAKLLWQELLNTVQAADRDAHGGQAE